MAWYGRYVWSPQLVHIKFVHSIDDVSSPTLQKNNVDWDNFGVMIQMLFLPWSVDIWNGLGLEW